jgi:hypothetical protein
LTTWENNFAVANADIFSFFSCRKYTNTQSTTHKAHSLQCPPSHLPLY